MVVDINLLPRTESKRNLKMVLMMVLFGMFLIASVLLWVQIGQIRSQNESLETQIDSVRQLRMVEEKKLDEDRQPKETEAFKNVVEWTRTFPVPTVLFLQHVTALLPERGFFISYDSADDGAVHLVVQFDTIRDAAYYLNHLKDSEFVEDVSLLSVDTSEIRNENQEGGMEDSKFLPRYIGSYRLNLNKPALQHAAGEGEN